MYSFMYCCNEWALPYLYATPLMTSSLKIYPSSLPLFQNGCMFRGFPSILCGRALVFMREEELEKG